ncbi:hypothetical protein B4Q04_00640 [Zobellia sp. OII3]|uniref:glycosyltransferase n=1 Tax=Zobellia sp. OII3 TaxID=2034520 RepID=UPI000B53304D|nr:glycosyltransferase [Zobellia sp. OII3]OWW26225.1 hypothetical protein B4Q04_00640 [Zobellia sp. OII3]
MKIVLLNHHEQFMGYSMTRYANYLCEGMKQRGHDCEIWYPKSYLAKRFFPQGIKKWLRYCDQFLIFPIYFLIRSSRHPKTTIYVLVDQALGMWMPLIKNRKHVVHCHDFTALKSSLGEIKENPTGLTGKMYQKLILKGFKQAKCFISVSKHTQKELNFFLEKTPSINEQVYNALDTMFKPGSVKDIRLELCQHLGLSLEEGYILHVGGNDFYKNRIGVIALYNAWRKKTKKSIPLLMIGYAPSLKIKKYFESSPYKHDIHFLKDVDNNLLLKAYQGAKVFVFPSLYEGFGWPVAEAMASGSPVITTNEAPMNEVGGDAAIYIDKCSLHENISKWAVKSAEILEYILSISDSERVKLVEASLLNSKRFEPDRLLQKIEKIYKQIEGIEHTS